MLIINLSAIFALLLHLATARVFTKCELAKELSRYGIPFHEIGTYVCIAERQSGFNTNIVGQGLYFGMYQISSEFWCDNFGRGKECKLNCNNLLNSDISDDIQCVRIIVQEHQRWSGNGFNAWPSGASCRSLGNSYIADCSIKSNQIIDTYSQVKHQTSVQTQINQSNNIKTGKVYERCELAKELKYKHDFPMEQIATWICIAKYESNFNTSAVGRLNFDGSEDHGLFQISDLYWCGPTGKTCGLTCDELRDNDITNDVECIKKIHSEHTRLSGDGFTAWAVYPRCKDQSESFIKGCFDDSSNEIVPLKPLPGVQQPAQPKYPTPHNSKTSSEQGKIYERCELARELKDTYSIPFEEIATWVCIAKHESNYNTSAIGRLNWDGSEDHGLFQISDIYWCGTNGKACNAQCSQFEDSDITDDVECIRKIHDEHTRLSGDGFNAWSVYKPKCKGRSESFIKGCFENISNEIIQSKPQPGIQQHHMVQYSKTTDQHREYHNKIPRKGKVYERCELAQELRYKHKIPMEQVATWVCIAKHESNFNTSAIGLLNSDGSQDHGLFQISDIYWCSPPGQGKGCELSCAELEDNDIRDDVECILKIFEEHTNINGDGFTAWAVYKPHCYGTAESYIDGCFNGDENIIHRPAVTQPSTILTTKKISTHFSTALTRNKPALSSTTFKSIPTIEYYQVTRSFEPVTTTEKFMETTMHETTSELATTDRVLTQSKTTQKIESTTANFINTSPPISPFNVFDLYLNSLRKISASNAVKQTKSTTIQTSRNKPRSTKSYISTTSRPMPATSTAISSKSYETPSTAYSTNLSKINLNSLTSKEVSTQTISSLISMRKQTTSPKVNIKSTPKGSVLQQTFNIFSLYLKDFTSTPAPIKTKPLEFSDRSTVIFKKSKNVAMSIAQASSEMSTTKRSTLKTSILPARSSLSVNPLPQHDFNSAIGQNRIGRLVTSPSIEYLLTLTTPRTTYR